MAKVQIKSEKLTPFGGIFPSWSNLMHFGSNHRFQFMIEMHAVWLSSRIFRIKKRSFMKSFIAINLFGIIVTCEELSKVELNHELIHTAQAKELLYIPFYLWYIIEWFYLYLKYRITHSCLNALTELQKLRESFWPKKWQG